MTTHPVLLERRDLCDLFSDLGPDAPTRCEGWTTRDLAAHLWAREHRPDVGPGLVTDGVFSRHTERVEGKVATRPYDETVAALRSGPTWFWPGRWAPNFDVHEWFVHHEDVRRANAMPPRDLGELDPLVWEALARWGKALTRSLDVGVRLVTPDGRERDVHDGAEPVVLTGAPGELLLRLFGRDAAVDVTGDDAAVTRFEASDLGI